MSHPQDLAVDNSEVSSGWFRSCPAGGKPCHRLLPAVTQSPPQHSAYSVHLDT